MLVAAPSTSRFDATPNQIRFQHEDQLAADRIGTIRNNIIQRKSSQRHILCCCCRFFAVVEQFCLQSSHGRAGNVVKVALWLRNICISFGPIALASKKHIFIFKTFFFIASFFKVSPRSRLVARANAQESLASEQVERETGLKLATCSMHNNSAFCIS